MTLLEINTGAGFVPIACLTSFQESESANTIGTTTRDTGGWRDGFMTFQEKVITGDGLIPVDNALLSYDDIVALKRARTVFTWRIGTETGDGLFSAIDLNISAGEDVAFTFTIECIGRPSSPVVPTGYTVSFVNAPFTGSNFSYRFDNAEVGATYNIEVTSSGGGTPYTNTGTVTSPTQQFLAQSIGDLQAGTLTITMTLTNGAGTGAPVQDTALYAPGATVPTISIGPPVPTTVTAGTAIEFLITYGNADAITLASGDVSLTTTGTATSPIQITGSGLTERTVRLFNPTGDGTIKLTSQQVLHQTLLGQPHPQGHQILRLFRWQPHPDMLWRGIMTRY